MQNYIPLKTGTAVPDGMAKQSHIFIKGRIGNLVFFERNGQHLVRSKPASVRQTGRMKQCSTNFGMAARAGKTLRANVAGLLPFPKDKKMQSRFSGAIAQWLGSRNIHEIPTGTPVETLYHFNFNEQSRFSERFPLPIGVSLSAGGQVRVNIPAFIPTALLTAPAHSSYIILTIIITGCSLTAPVSGVVESYQCRVDYNNHSIDALQLEWTLNIPTGIILVAASLSFWLKNGKQELKETYLPAAVLDAAYY